MAGIFNKSINQLDSNIELALKTHPKKDISFNIVNAIELYIKKHALLVSIKSNGSYNIYKRFIFKHANNLANELSELTKYVILYTKIVNKVFWLRIDGVIQVYFYDLDTILNQFIKPIKENNFLIYPPEFELINIYRNLYNPVYYEDWESLTIDENKLYKYLLKRKSIVVGSSDIPTGNIHQLLLQFIKRKDIILLGDNAIKLSRNQKIHTGKIQLITNDIKRVSSLLMDILKYNDYKPKLSKYNVELLTEPRLRKFTIRVNKHIIELFNTAQFELVPYHTINKVNIGDVNVLSAFALIDIWLIKRLNIITKMNIPINRLFNTLIQIKKIKYKGKKEWLGCIYSLNTYFIKNMTGIFPYTPQLYKLQKGKFRIV